MQNLNFIIENKVNIRKLFYINICHKVIYINYIKSTINDDEFVS